MHDIIECIYWNEYNIYFSDSIIKYYNHIRKINTKFRSLIKRNEDTSAKENFIFLDWNSFTRLKSNSDVVFVTFLVGAFYAFIN